MKRRPPWRGISLLGVIATHLLLVQSPAAAAQNRGVGGGGGAPGGPFESAQAAAPIDLTGSWISVVTEDWRVRMVTPPKGYYESVPMTAESRRVADSWDPEEDEANGLECKAYGAAAIMRVPGRLRIRWEDPDTIRMDTDAGTQTRMFHFSAAANPEEQSWQGHSMAEWEYADTQGRQPLRGNLKVVTTGMRAGYLRKNGVPYSEDAVSTEYYDVISAPDGGEWLVVLTEVIDPLYLSAPFITSTQFKRLPEDSGWNPTPCSAR